MKLKSLFALAAATIIAAAAFVTSCDDADNDFHQFYWQGTHEQATPSLFMLTKQRTQSK